MTDNRQKQQNQQSQTPEQLSKALGKTEPKVEVKPEVKSEVKPEVKPEAQANVLETILKNLPEKVRETIMKLPEANRTEIAQDYFKLAHPEGLASEFNAKLTAELPKFVEALAKEFMVDVKGKQIQVMFPDGEGTPTAGIVDPKATGSGKKKAGETKAQWGESSVTHKDGKVMNYESAGAMGKALGYLMKGWQFKDTTECFTKPYDLNGNQLKQRFIIESAERGKGIHIKEIA